MSDAELLKPCPYRKDRGGYLICSIAETTHEKTTDITIAKLCKKCSVPDILTLVNCANLFPGKRHQESSTFSGFHVSEIEYRIDCTVFGFNHLEEYKTKCSPNCPAYQPIHRDLSTEETISVPNFDATQAKDRKLRQAVLAILYKYHAQHPERYHHFDVTPEFIRKSLGISVPDVVRVVSPMEDEGEVEIFRYPGDLYFNYVRITSKGIQMIDEEPLFERLDTAGVRIMGDYFHVSPKDSQVGAMNVGSHNHNQTRVHQNMGVSATDLKELFAELHKNIDTLPTEQQEEATELVNALEEEAQSQNPRKAIVNAYAQQLGKFLRDAAANTLGTIVGALLAAG